MKQVEHGAFMEMIQKKKNHLMILIGLLVLAFGTYLVFVRPVLRAYI